jgi:alcohol dehydrogenase
VNFTGGDTWVESLKCLRRGGTMLTCGATAGFAPVEDIRYIWTFELRVQGSNGWYPEDLRALLAAVRENRLKPLIDRTFPLSDVHAAFRCLEDREVFGKVLVAP